MPREAIEIASPDAPRLGPYRDLKRTNLTRWPGLFVAEGTKVVSRLIESDFVCESVLVSDRRRDFLRTVPHGVPAFVLPEAACESLIG